MASYLLLRDNKESGPYSLDGLKNLGLKAYDLVWIQGRSAAWRYSGEVDELKEFAPQMEEQPFNRFYIKKSDARPEEIFPEKKENIAFNKTVFIKMPETEKIKTYEPVDSGTFNNVPSVSKTITVTENPAAAEVKYSQPLDEIKEMYVKTLHQRKQKIARKNFFLKNLKKASVLFYMITLGIVIGYTLKSNSGKKNIAAGQEIKQPEQIQLSTTQSTINNNNPVQKRGLTDDLKSKNENNNKTHFLKPTNQENISNSPKKQLVLKNNNAINSNTTSPGVEMNPVTGERNKKIRNNVERQKQTSKQDISNLVTVKSSDYKRGAFGGIRDLQLTVTNNSKYILDTVTVELQYLKPSEQPLKTEEIPFRLISPNGSMTVAIPPTNRGIKVMFKIIKIESKELNRETAGL